VELAVWRRRRTARRAAYAAGARRPGPEARTAYVAAEDQADAALESLSAHAEPRALLAA
jgi:hypothetical protein